MTDVLRRLNITLTPPVRTDGLPTIGSPSLDEVPHTCHAYTELSPLIVVAETSLPSLLMTPCTASYLRHVCDAAKKPKISRGWCIMVHSVRLYRSPPSLTSKVDLMSMSGPRRLRHAVQASRQHVTLRPYAFYTTCSTERSSIKHPLWLLGRRRV
ncbi:hypothetical protein BD310DRAFT_651847 [Dichomitus squalens]|uniref:Uncharacterized protein n=1 Tax=Dichomitus squalens TaxID=114155 RepID=A0A4Q9PNN5_9APHY|nr:hypothetical protein BD310DRAFT_651847 [Dichomitus squalens]